MSEKKPESKQNKDLRKSARVLEQARELGKALDTEEGKTPFPCEFTASGAGKTVGNIEA